MHAQERLARLAGNEFMAVVLFHRVTDDIPEDGLTVSTKWFRRFCKLMRQKFHVVPLAEIHRTLKAQQTPALRTLAITFDDCYRDNLLAAQVLAEHKLPATFFLPSGRVGTEHVFPWDKGLRRLPNLTWSDVKEMQALGHDFGSHTVTHADLGAVGPDEARREMCDSKKALEDKLQIPVRWLGYPYGGRHNFRPEYLPVAYELGYDACFSGHGGFISRAMLGGILPREPLPEFRSLLKLELHLRGSLNWLYSLKRWSGLSRDLQVCRQS